MNSDICYLNREALFCAETEDYRIPAEPEENQEVALRFRTAREDADRILYRECGSELALEMVKTSCDAYFDYYESGRERSRYDIILKLRKAAGPASITVWVCRMKR